MLIYLEFHRESSCDEKFSGRSIGIKWVQCTDCFHSNYERPRQYIFVDELPRTIIGKVDYRELEKIANK